MSDRNRESSNEYISLETMSVSCPTDRANKFRLLENRQTNFGEAECAEHLARGLLDAVPQRGLRRKNVAHAFDGLEFHFIGQGLKSRDLGDVVAEAPTSRFHTFFISFLLCSLCGACFK